MSDTATYNVMGRADSRSVKFVTSPVKGTPAVEVAFTFDFNERPRSAVWSGWLSEGAEARTIEALKLCGCTEAEIAAGEEGIRKGIARNEVSLEYDAQQNRINWVNTGSIGVEASGEQKGAIKNQLAEALRRMKGLSAVDGDMPF